MAAELWVDGGVVLKNPSPHAGTWAWVLTEDGAVADKRSGVLTPEKAGRPLVTNNLTELYAAMQALDANPDFAGTLFSDSQVTLHRLLDGGSFVGIPQWLRLRCLRVRRGRKWEAVLVAGHPSKKELLDGVRKRNGLPTSQWNALADKMCRLEAERFLTR